LPTHAKRLVTDLHRLEMNPRMTDGLELSIGQFRGAWTLMCAGTAGYTRAEANGLEYIFSGLPISFFNIALLTGRGVSTDALASQGHEACAWASDKGVPWFFILTHEALATGFDAAAVLDGCGLAPVMPLTGMQAQQIAAVERIPDGLQLAVPDDDAACAALLDVNSAAYGMDLEEGKAVMGKRSFWKGHAPVLGRVGGTPTSCAAVMMVDGHRYVALVATDPAHQRRGYGEAAMRRALEVAADAHGERLSVLHATDAGRPIYQRMGYTVISSHTLFMEKRFLTGH
jgi:ribosomal protein S18 acetylase RimI-like enzyme